MQRAAGNVIQSASRALLFCMALVGCGSQKQADQQQVELPAWLKEEPKRAASAQAEVRTVSDNNTSARLGLNLRVGDRFPLRKKVQQELIQGGLNGEPIKNFSQLELLMAITVSEVQNGRTKLSVRYDRVKYRHEVADDQVDFDSTRPEESTSMGVVAYRDMINDGFSFWIGEDNQIAEVEGLAEFINRCLRNVPAEHRKDVILGIEAGTGESGIANFVDNSIGLLPYGRDTRPGDSWERQQQIGRPVPMHISNVYTLKELVNGQAIIDVRGTITPSTTLSTLESGNGVRVLVNGGSTIGSCSIYRDTGLPKESRVDRVVEMTVIMENAISFRQTKRITTTIESFPASPALPLNMNVSNPGSTGGIQQVSGEFLSR